MRNTTGRWLTTVTAVGGLLTLASPAIAAQAAPSVMGHAVSTQQHARGVTPGVPGTKAVADGVGDSGQICLKNAPSYCIKANGGGNQVTITNVAADKANFTVVFDSMGDFEWQDGNGNCLREGTGGVVKIENGSCASNNNDTTDQWYYIMNQISNLKYTAIMYTTGDANGDNVWADSDPPSGSWEKWNAPT